MNDRSDEPTETDDRVAEHQQPSPIAGVSGGAPMDHRGLPQGMHDEDHSPLTMGDTDEAPR